MYNYNLYPMNFTIHTGFAININVKYLYFQFDDEILEKVGVEMHLYSNT